jgi:hypothetical protein
LKKLVENPEWTNAFFEIGFIWEGKEGFFPTHLRSNSCEMDGPTFKHPVPQFIEVDAPST